MRALSVQELDLVVGGYDDGQSQAQVSYSTNGDVVTAVGFSDADASGINNALNTLSGNDLNAFASQTAQSFGINIGPVQITPITPLNPKDGIKYGGTAKVRC